MFDDIKDKQNLQSGDNNGPGFSPASNQGAPVGDKMNEKRDGNSPPSPFAPPPPVTPIANNSGISEAEKEKGAKGGVEDILSDTDNEREIPEKPTAFQPKETPQSTDLVSPEARQVATKNSKKKILTLGLLIVGLAVIGLGSVWGYRAFIGNSNTLPELNDNKGSSADEDAPVNRVEPTPTQERENEASKTGEETNSATSPSKPAPSVPTTPSPREAKDSDSDGLTDAEEEALGMDINSVDSDNDGLFDREEVKVYKTNPTNPDTDGDGFLDGDEVRDGYNPNGSGKMYEIK